MMNIEQITAAASIARAKAINSPEWTRAIEKAAKMLASGELCVTLFADNTALVTSPNGSYRVNGHCPCAARTSHCYHRAAKRLVEMLDAVPGMHGTGTMGVAQCETTPAADIRAEIRATFAKNHPGFYLADTVQRLCGPYSLEMLGVANLNYVLNAIA